MKNIVLIMTLIVSCLFAGCDSFANKSENKLSGDDFWMQGNETNAEAFLLSIYNSFRNATISQCPFLTHSGDMWCAPITAYSTEDKYVAYLANNDMGELRNTYPDDVRGGLIMQWDVFHTAAQDVNTLLAEIDKMPGMDELKWSRFKAEAIFMCSLFYFFIVRAFGDVPYYTNAYNEAPLPRTSMVIASRNCPTDLQPLLDDDPGAEALPWSYLFYSSRGIRASRGSVIALMMHISLWPVQFNVQNKEQYYRNVVSLGEELERSNGAYSLLDINRSSVIFAGGLDEGLFETVQNMNFNEIFTVNVKFSDNVSYSYLNKSMPLFCYSGDYFMMLSPMYEDDARKELWLDEKIYSTSVSSSVPKEIKKFWSIDIYGNGTITFNSGNQIVFRYTGAPLLYAEAFAVLGTNDTKTCELLNRVRNRAYASEINTSGSELMDAIFWERCRELIGEGRYYYDLVRIGKTYNRNYCMNPMMRTNFDVGAWTWPIHRNALKNNTQIRLNSSWE